MRKCHGGKTQFLIRPPHHSAGQSQRTSDDKHQRTGDKAGALLHALPPYIGRILSAVNTEGDHIIFLSDLLQKLSPFRLPEMLEKEYIDSWYTSFAAGAVLISIPIAALFLYMQRYYVDGLSGAVKG